MKPSLHVGISLGVASKDVPKGRTIAFSGPEEAPVF